MNDKSEETKVRGFDASVKDEEWSLRFSREELAWVNVVFRVYVLLGGVEESIEDHAADEHNKRKDLRA